MKRLLNIVSLFMALLILASGARFGLNFHFCQDNLAEISWNGNPKNCKGKRMQLSGCKATTGILNIHPKPCCSDQLLTVDTDTPNIFTADYSIAVFDAIIDTPSLDFVLKVLPVTNSNTKKFDPPDPNHPPLYLKFSRLIHYG